MKCLPDRTEGCPSSSEGSGKRYYFRKVKRSEECIYLSAKVTMVERIDRAQRLVVMLRISPDGCPGWGPSIPDPSFKENRVYQDLFGIRIFIFGKNCCHN
jgi:hypothetical protein